MSNVYLKRYAHPAQLIPSDPHRELGLIITIPAYCENGLADTLSNLAACELPECAVEVIVVINQASGADTLVTAINQKSYRESVDLIENAGSDRFKFHVFYINDLPPKHAGVGLARKIAMDEAVRRFEAIKRPEGIIVGYDADCLCEPNYLVALESHFQVHSHSPGCSIYFEHPLEGDLPLGCYEAIAEYELHLRYYVNALRYAGFPLAFQTIGSSMAVRCHAYQKQGGMNRRKAGEDFYFLQRIMRLGNFTELNSTRVIPSPRVSDRVPFGTGKAVGDWQQQHYLNTYHPDIFDALKDLLDNLDDLYQLPSEMLSEWLDARTESISAFLQQAMFSNQLMRLQKHSLSLQSFRKHFFQWFDGFQVLKYVHFTRDNYYPNTGVKEAASSLLEKLNYPAREPGLLSSLKAFRHLDRSGRALS